MIKTVSRTSQDLGLNEKQKVIFVLRYNCSNFGNTRKKSTTQKFYLNVSQAFDKM